MISTPFQTKSRFAASYHAQGKAEGLAEGLAEGETDALLTVLDTRGLAVTDEQRDRIESCTDVDTIRLWLRRAVTATTTDELFA